MESSRKPSVRLAISHKYSFTDVKQNVFAAKFSPYGQLLATTYSDGSLRIHSATHGEMLHTLKVPHLDKHKRPECDVEQGKDPMIEDDEVSPHANCITIDADHSITAVAWKPDGKSDESFTSLPTTKNPLSLRAATSDGRILRWNFEKPEELIEDIFSSTNYYHTIDYSYDGGAKFACAGFEPVVEVYDEETL